MRIASLAAPVLLIALCASAAPPETHITSSADALRLAGAKGVTLQWIDWNRRGSMRVVRGATWRLTAAQAQANGLGRLWLDGSITEIGAGYFVLRGTIRIADAPDRGRRCAANKDWRFAITQGRPYYRLREFEWCDGLTDYIDIYF